MNQGVPAVLSLNAGYVDTAGFLALQGLFTAHVTGNFVTLGAALVFGTSGIVAKLLALPVFCVVIVVTRLLASSLSKSGLPALRMLLSLKLLLLIVGAAAAIGLAGGGQGKEALAVLAGLPLVSAMAIQNAVSRIHLGAAPPTTLMTGSTTQMMMDLADLVRGLSAEERGATLARLRKMATNVVAFAVGCGAGAFLFDRLHMWCFAVPPLVALVAILMEAAQADQSANALPDRR
jgi:uncharacterized membrane protein YoaK (UPF0700 family)